jgi:phage shock protein E
MALLLEAEMHTLVKLLLLVVMSFSVFAADVRFNGVKPDFIVDVRTVAEYSSGHIDGAINIPVDQVSQQISGVKGLNQGSRILVYCRSGRRSAMAAQILQQQGYKRVLDGGAIETLAKSLKQCTSATC